MKRITALITVLTMLFSLSIPAWAASTYVAVSKDKPIAALVGANPTNDKKANDAEPNSEFVSNKSIAENALTISLGNKFILDHVIVDILSEGTVTVLVSNKQDFLTYTELEYDSLVDGYKKKYRLPAAKANDAFGYVRLKFTRADEYSDVYVYDFQAYTTEQNALGVGNVNNPEDFSEELIKVSEGKSILSKLYGTGGYGSFTAEKAVDDSTASRFISCGVRTRIEWLTIDLGEEQAINKIETIFTAQRTYHMLATNTSYGQDEEFADGVELVETSSGSKNFVMPDEHKGEAYRYVRLKFEGDAPNTGNDTEQNMEVYDISVYISSRDMVYNTAAEKYGTLTDGDKNTPTSIANNTVIDLLTPSYIRSYKLYGADKNKVTLKGSLFNTTPDNMTVIPESSTDDGKYRFVALVTDDGETASLNEMEVMTYYSDIVTPVKKNGKAISLKITNTSHKDTRSYTVSGATYDEYGTVLGVKTLDESLQSGTSKEISFDIDGADVGSKTVVTVERDDMLAAVPTIIVNNANVLQPQGTPYTSAPEKDLDKAVTKTDYNDGLTLSVAATDGICDSDIITFDVYNSSDVCMAKDAAFKQGTFTYRLPGTAPAGTYKAVVTVSSADGSNVGKDYTFTKTAPTEQELTAAINAFKNATTAEEFAAAYQTHYVTNGTIGFGDIPEAAALLDSGIGESFIKMMSAMTLWKKNVGAELTAEDIRDCMKAAAVENYLENKRANSAAVLFKYASLLDNVFDGTQNNAYTAEIFKTGATTNDELIYNMRIAAALSKIKNATTEEIVSVLQNYSTILDVDIAAINASGVDIYLVARRLDKTIPESYKDGLSAEISAILGENTSTGGDNNTPSTPSSPGGGGGGGESTSVYVKPDNTQKEPQQEESTETKPVFGDVSAGHWAATSIEKLANAGIISGRGNGNYDPNSLVSRAEFATMLVKAFSLISAPDKKPGFNDCKVSDWFYPYVDAAVSNGIVNGISKDEFAPDAPITRQDACVMSYNIMIYKNFLKYYEGKNFTDSDSISEYAKEAVAILSGSGVINGFADGSFAPQKLLTRAEAAVIIDKLMTVLGEEA